MAEPHLAINSHSRIEEMENQQETQLKPVALSIITTSKNSPRSRKVGPTRVSKSLRSHQGNHRLII